MMWKRGFLALLALLLVACSAPSAAPGTSGATGETDELRKAAETLAGLAVTPEARLAIGYDAAGKLLVWLSLIPRYPEYAQGGSPAKALAITAQIFQSLPKVQGVWVALEEYGLTVVYLPRNIFESGTLRSFDGDWRPYFKMKWDGLAERHWAYELRRTSHYDTLVDEKVAEHLRTLFGERLVSVEVFPQDVITSGVRVVVRDIPAGDQAMEEWARAAVAVTGRFHQMQRGLELDEMIWVDRHGSLQHQSHMTRRNYAAWWESGMRPGRWLTFGSPMDGLAEVEFLRDLEPPRTSYAGPWWEGGATIKSASEQISALVPGAEILFVGRQEGNTVAALSVDAGEQASMEQLWEAQMKAAMAVMAQPVSEVWVFARAGDKAAAVYLDRFGYDALAYPDKQMPPVTPDLWPYVVPLYGEGTGK